MVYPIPEDPWLPPGKNTGYRPGGYPARNNPYPPQKRPVPTPKSAAVPNSPPRGAIPKPIYQEPFGVGGKGTSTPIEGLKPWGKAADAFDTATGAGALAKA